MREEKKKKEKMLKKIREESFLERRERVLDLKREREREESENGACFAYLKCSGLRYSTSIGALTSNHLPPTSDPQS